MKAYPFFLSKLFCSPVMVLEPVRLALEHELLARMGLSGISALEDESSELATLARRPVRSQKEEEHEAEAAERKRETPAERAERRTSAIYQVYGNTAVLSLNGVIDKNLSDFELNCFGGVDLADVDRALSMAAANKKVERVVLDWNSPGGSVTGVPETAARVAQLRETKEVISRVEMLCASAAYYIGSQADQIVASPSAVLGSIGVYCALMDQTRALEMRGYKVELIKAGKYKAAGASFKTLTDSERELFQAEITALHDEFKTAVNSARPQVAQETMEGQTFRGRRAMTVGLADVMDGRTLDEFVSALM